MLKRKSGYLLTVILILTSIIFVASFSPISYGFFVRAYGQNAGAIFDRDKALNFLMSLLTNYNQDRWLCREYNDSNNYWIYNDNALAYQILSYEGNLTDNATLLGAAEKIRQTIEDQYNFSLANGSDRIEVMFNQSITYPPYSSTGASYSPIVESDMQLGPNLVNNPSVESGSVYPDSWFESNWTIRTFWPNNTGRTGNRSLELVANSSSDNWRSGMFNVTSSENYLINCYVNGTVIVNGPVSNLPWCLTVRWHSDYDSASPVISSNDIPIDIENYTTWTQTTGFNFTAPPNAVAADLLFQSEGGTGTLYADDFSVNQIINPGSYIVRNDAKQFQDYYWQNYSDLFVYGIVDEWLNNQKSKALNDFETLIKTNCRTEGVQDGPWAQSGGEYQTYKTALVLICSEILNHSIPYNYTQILCQMQMPDGGFRTGYFAGIIPNPNATENVETTCWAIYALDYVPSIPEFPNTVFCLYYRAFL